MSWDDINPAVQALLVWEALAAVFQRLWPQWQYTLLSRILFQTTEEQERTLASEACSIHQRGSLDEAESCKKSESREAGRR